MVRRMMAGACLAAVLPLLACGGGGATTPTSPSSPPTSGPPPAAGLMIDIRSTSNAQSFAPNPAAMSAGGTVAWRNSDGQTHRIVANDSSFDTGDIAPGATSRALSLARGTNYHCSLHTVMVGAIGIEAEPPPPCTGPYC